MATCRVVRCGAHPRSSVSLTSSRCAWYAISVPSPPGSQHDAISCGSVSSQASGPPFCWMKRPRSPRASVGESLAVACIQAFIEDVDVSGARDRVDHGQVVAGLPTAHRRPALWGDVPGASPRTSLAADDLFEVVAEQLTQLLGLTLDLLIRSFCLAAAAVEAEFVRPVLEAGGVDDAERVGAEALHDVVELRLATPGRPGVERNRHGSLLIAEGDRVRVSVWPIVADGGSVADLNGEAVHVPAHAAPPRAARERRWSSAHTRVTTPQQPRRMGQPNRRARTRPADQLRHVRPLRRLWSRLR